MAGAIVEIHTKEPASVAGYFDTARTQAHVSGMPDVEDIDITIRATFSGENGSVEKLKARMDALFCGDVQSVVTKVEPQKTATFIRSLENDSDAIQRLYRVEPPMPEICDACDEVIAHHDYVVVSALESANETIICPGALDSDNRTSTERLADWLEGVDHEGALRAAGYEVEA